MSNANIIAFLTDEFFVEDTSEHKYPLLWTSNFHKIYNKIMRGNDLDALLKKLPGTLYFTRKLIKYFLKYGVTKDKLKERGIQYLYRGLEKKFEWGDEELIENSFLATSSNILVSEKFADLEGTLLIFNVDDLPDKVPFIILDTSIAPYLFEAEVLCLPFSTIKTRLITDKDELEEINKKLKYKNLNRIYHCKYILKKSYLFKIMEKQKGGSTYANELSLNTLRVSTITSGKIVTKQEKPIKHYLFPTLELAGKYVVFYRAILDRPIELFKHLKIPDKEQDIYKFFYFEVSSFDNQYDMINNYIPELQDLWKKSRDSDPQLTKKINSYEFHTAIYDPISKLVIDLHYGMPYFKGNEYEVNTDRNKEIINAIVEHMNKLKL